MHDGRCVVVSQLLVKVLQALDYPWRNVSILVFPHPSGLRLTSLMLVVSEHTARDSPVILLYWADILGIGWNRVSFAIYPPGFAVVVRTVLNSRRRHNRRPSPLSGCDSGGGHHVRCCAQAVRGTW